MSPSFLRSAATALLAAVALLPVPTIAADPETWPAIRNSLFQERPIEEAAGDLLRLEAPGRAEDAAVVPVAIHTGFDQANHRYVQRTWLVIDQNPSPVAAIFNFTPDSGRADIDTRVRINAYTLVRAIAELNDGSLHMVTRFVKASGGCSAPASKDPAEAAATLGRMKVRVDGDVAVGRPVLAQLMISHPNDSGLAMDQISRNYTPAHFVREVTVSYANHPVLTADLDISISENPNIRFYFVPHGAGELAVDVVDSKDLHFRSALKLDPNSGVAASVRPESGS
jgi:sulfur-oxidizing protein SoxY